MNHQVSPPTHRALRCTRRCSWPAGGPHVLAARCAAPPPGGSQTLWSCWGSHWGKYWGSSSSPPQPSCFSPSAQRCPEQGHIATSLNKHAIMGGACAQMTKSGQQEQNKLKIGAGPLLSRKRRFLSCVNEDMRRAEISRATVMCKDRQMRHADLVDGNRCLLFSFNMQIPSQTTQTQRTSCSC